MARKKRFWTPQSFYHIVCRGNRREALFKDDRDYKVFMYILQSVNEKISFELASYCLMPNHFHLQLRSESQSISKVMSLINKRYADYFNAKNDVTGHVFEKRFFDQIIEPGNGMLEVSRYIHLNPAVAGIVEKAEYYRWSSYRYYLYTKNRPLLNMQSVLDYYDGNEQDKRKRYQAYVEEKIEIPDQGLKIIP